MDTAEAQRLLEEAEAALRADRPIEALRCVRRLFSTDDLRTLAAGTTDQRYAAAVLEGFDFLELTEGAHVAGVLKGPLADSAPGVVEFARAWMRR